MPLNSLTVQRIIGVLVLLAGVALIAVSSAGQTVLIVIGVVLMVLGFWLSYVKNEIAKIRGEKSQKR